MKDLTTEKYLDHGENIYALVVLAARRTIDLTQGSKSLVPEATHLKPAIVALQEIEAGKIKPVFPEEEEPEEEEEEK